MKRPKQEFYVLFNLDTGEIKFFASLVSTSIHFGKCKSQASHIVREKDGKYKNYQIMKGDDNLCQ